MSRFKKYICTYPDQEEVYLYGKGDTVEESIRDFQNKFYQQDLDALNCFEDGEEICYEVYTNVLCSDKAVNQISLEGMIEYSLDEMPWIDYPSQESISELEKLFKPIFKKWISINTDWDKSFSLEDKVDSGEFIYYKDLNYEEV